MRVPTRRWEPTWLVVGIALLLVVGSATVRSVTARDAAPGTPVAAGYRDFSYRTPNGVCSRSPTATMTESKLWWNDGSWWGSLCNDAAEEYHIYRLDSASQTWIDTGTPLDPRASSRADVLWDGRKLYVASHLVLNGGEVSPDPKRWGRLYRYSYHAATDTYTPDDLEAVDGEPFAYLNRGRSDPLTLAKDSTGRLWVTYTLSNSVYLNHTLGDDGAWGTPFVLPLPEATGLTIDGISTIIAFEGHVGVMWSDENSGSIYFAAHPDSAGERSGWSVVSAHDTPNAADDHINLAYLPPSSTGGSGSLFAVVKTSTSPAQVDLLRCRTDRSCTEPGTWSVHPVYKKNGDVRPTRPILLVDEANRWLYVFATTPEGGGIITYKSSPVDKIDFGAPDVPGTPFIVSELDPNINNPTSTKQNLNRQTGLVVLASDSSTGYYLHNVLDLTVPPTRDFFVPLLRRAP